ncbi:MAG TPA: ABC transporter transmembrane domain-containing protein, partial [Spirochaetia bacterium]|nr:ABC transporter transmembrane domain-containing protein [Spirochaetia bacterium]
MLKEFRTLFPYLKRYLPFYLGGFFFLIVTDAGQLFIPQLIRQAINHISSGNVELSVIFRLMLEMVALALAVAIGRFGWRYFIHGSSRKIEKELRDRFFSHLLKLSPSFFGRYKTGDLMARATNDMNAIRNATGMATVAFVDG